MRRDSGRVLAQKRVGCSPPTPTRPRVASAQRQGMRSPDLHAGSIGSTDARACAGPRCHPESGAPAGGIRLPIARADAWPTHAAKGKEPPGATRSHAQPASSTPRRPWPELSPSSGAWRGWRGRTLA